MDTKADGLEERVSAGGLAFIVVPGYSFLLRPGASAAPALHFDSLPRTCPDRTGKLPMRYASRLLIAAAVILATAGHARAWNKAGHMVTGIIAYRELKAANSQAAARLIAVLKKHRDFDKWKARMDQMGLAGDDRDLYIVAAAARWPDDIRGDASQDHADWHFINIPVKPGEPAAPVVPTGTNILTAFDANAAALITPGDDAARAIALCWVLHLIGDVHQPLHTVKLVTNQFPQGDRGGTRFYIRATPGAATISLHAFWDDLILGSERFQDARNTATELAARPEHRRAALEELGETAFRQWAQVESYHLAEAAAYRHGDLKGSRDEDDGEVLPGDYAKPAKRLAERRAMLAGYRAADLLAMAFGAGSPPAGGTAGGGTTNGGASSLFVASWNVENLFDAEDDPTLPGDEEFTPGGAKHWTPERLQTKLGNLARVINKMGDGQGPDVLGLCEVENRKVVEALVAKLGARGREYRIVHQDSPSDRGIDCAIVYDAGKLELKDAKFHRVDVNPDKTRDIVEAKFAQGGDVLYVFANHWPSRANPESERNVAAGVLRARIDAILADDPAADIVILGDLNDEPSDASVKTTLRAAKTPDGLPAGALFDSMARFQGSPDQGTIVHEEQWQVFDHVVLSRGLLDNSRFRWEPDSTRPLILLDEQIFRRPGHTPQPNRTYSGNMFHPDGFSDHLPVGCILRRG